MKAATAQRQVETSENPALSAWIRVLKVHNLVFRELRTRMAPYCTMAQFDVIAQLSREKQGTTPAQLSRMLLVTAGNLTGLLDRMEKSGLVAREADAKDRRVTRVQLTGRGKELARKVIPIHAREIQQIIPGLDPGELDHLRTLLDKWIDALPPANGKENEGAR